MLISFIKGISSIPFVWILLRHCTTNLSPCLNSIASQKETGWTTPRLLFETLSDEWCLAYTFICQPTNVSIYFLMAFVPKNVWKSYCIILPKGLFRCLFGYHGPRLIWWTIWAPMRSLFYNKPFRTIITKSSIQTPLF